MLQNGLSDYQNRLGPGIIAASPLKTTDLARKKGSGGSSYGFNRYYVLVENSTPGNLPAILEIKQLLPTSVHDDSSDLSKSNGAQVVEDQKALGGFANRLTGYMVMDGFHYIVQEREPEKRRCVYWRV